nr:unnamed protein product [Callosobruchus analis]
MICGKLNRMVPVLLDTNLLRCVQTMISNRQFVGVSTKNPYVFGLPGTGEKQFAYLRACNLLRRFSEECGANNPRTLRGTHLRKHIATACITLNLAEDEISDLANFMGHQEKIHKDIYRQPIASREISQISKLLEYAQGEEDSESEEEMGDNDNCDVESKYGSTEVPVRPSTSESMHTPGTKRRKSKCIRIITDLLLSTGL